MIYNLEHLESEKDIMNINFICKILKLRNISEDIEIRVKESI